MTDPQTTPNPNPPWSHPLVVADLSSRKPLHIQLSPPPELRQLIAAALGLISLRKLRFDATLSQVGRTDWTLSAKLGATAVQSCVITLEPVTTRIDEPVGRRYLRELSEHRTPERRTPEHGLPEQGTGSEHEMPADETLEQLSAIIDVGTVMLEALSLALPQFPRTPGAALEQGNFTEPGKPPMTDADARPFAQLKSLREAPTKPLREAPTKPLREAPTKSLREAPKPNRK